MIKLQSLGILFCIVLACWFLAHIPWARRRDAQDLAEWHLLHGPNDGCIECADK
ncbi:hypothetical protein [Pseudarthrobacter sp. LT1]|uniref:hypothetical protein n=1 Tax=Pseudarthrobacter sp. LT1 TaxID=3111450 RepID=UPI002D783F97|nr:hypothetical protein [Pseudarthrobacter sp. LT1]WRT14695.1 hypothetical protein VIK36_04150 [Pseudarthrobacter sp. LT1]